MTLTISPDLNIRHTFTKSVNQHSKDIQVDIEGVDLETPIVYSISNSLEQGNSITYTKNSTPLSIPDSFFVSGEYVHIWVPIIFSGDENDSSEMHVITIPVVKRPIPIVAPKNSFNYHYDEEDENFIIDDTITTDDEGENNNSSDDGGDEGDDNNEIDSGDEGDDGDDGEDGEDDGSDEEGV